MHIVPPVERRSANQSQLTSWRPLLLIGLLALTLFMLRLAAPANLLDQDQENPAAYVLDAVKNGHWICQHDLTGQITSKPPLYTWLAALITLLCGRVSLLSLYLPGALALLGQAWLVLWFGEAQFGRRVGLFAALACLLCTAGLKQIGLARTDGVFAFMVTAAALLGYRAWLRGQGWIWFWLMGAAATLTKGPLGLILAALGLLAYWWESRSGEVKPIRGTQLPGIFLFLVLTVGWLGLAYWELGQALLDKLFVQELAFHALTGEEKKFPGTLFYLSPLYYLGRAAPWSLLAYWGLWRIWRHPASDPNQRRFERFLCCWFLGALILFSVAPHQRGDLLWPILPAGALIAGRELAQLVARLDLDPRRVDRALAMGTVLAIAGFCVYYFEIRARQPLVQQTVVIQRLAERLQRVSGGDLLLEHTDDPTALQVFLNTCRRPISFAQAAALLRSDRPAYVAVSNRLALDRERRPGDPSLYTLWVAQGPVSALDVQIVSNRAEDAARFKPPASRAGPP